MGETVSTDENAVLEFTTNVLSANSTIDFKLTVNIHTSTSSATDELKIFLQNISPDMFFYLLYKRKSNIICLFKNKMVYSFIFIF